MLKFELINREAGRTAYFVDLDGWRYYGNPWCGLLPHNYGECVNQNDYYYILNNYSGFYENNPIENFFKTGINENGEVFKTNNFGNKLLNFNFTPAFNKHHHQLTSAANYLNSVLQNKNKPLLLRVDTGNMVFQMEVVSTDQTATESGVIQLTSAKDGDGIYWTTDEDVNHGITGDCGDDLDLSVQQPEPYITKLLEYIPLNKGVTSDIPSAVIDVLVDTSIIQIEVGDIYGSWNKIILTNHLTGQRMELTNKYGDDFLIITPTTKEITNKRGDNRLDCFNTSTGEFLTLGNGTNVIDFEIYDASGNLLNNYNSKLNISYKQLFTAIF